MSCSSRSTPKPSFFKVLLEDFDTKLEIPQQACIETFEFVPRGAVLRTQIGSWTVAVKKTRNDDDDYSLHFHGHGWIDLVKRNGFTKGDILVFSLMGGSGSEMASSSHFEVTLKRFNLFGLFVPAEFAEETGMRRRKTVMVKDSAGREWPVKVAAERGRGIFLGDGWGDFVKRNGLQVGMSCRIQAVTQYVVDDEDVDDADVLVLFVGVV